MANAMLTSPLLFFIRFTRFLRGRAIFSFHLVNSDGTGLQQLTREKEKGPYHPTWSPDGTELIYSARLDKPGLPAQLFKTDMKGGPSTQLTHEGDNIWPDWFNPTARSVSPSVHSLTTTWGKIKAD